MASFCRSAARSGMRSMAALREPKPKFKPFSPPFLFQQQALFLALLGMFVHSFFPPLRFAVALASVESMMPLHSAIASSRLKSSIAVDSSCWSWMSQGTTYLYLSL
ncbi:hypothetical protein MKW92_003385 [Papaver armeniacum]|nr:hypothetical protein MKW92_003385 [Papaver armeniacum]